MAQRPRAVDLFVCQNVIYEAETSNVTLVNRFVRLGADSFPVTSDPFIVFAFLTDGQGEVPLELVILRPDTLEEIYRREGTAAFSHPLIERRCRVTVADCTFPVAGDYHLSLLADGEPVASCRLTLFERQPP